MLGLLIASIVTSVLTTILSVGGEVLSTKNMAKVRELSGQLADTASKYEIDQHNIEKILGRIQNKNVWLATLRDNSTINPLSAINKQLDNIMESNADKINSLTNSLNEKKEALRLVNSKLDALQTHGNTSTITAGIVDRVQLTKDGKVPTGVNREGGASNRTVRLPNTMEGVRNDESQFLHRNGLI